MEVGLEKNVYLEKGADMRISRKYLLRYWWHSVRYMTTRERVYWIIILIYSTVAGVYIGFTITWWFGILAWTILMLQGRFPMHYKLNMIGQYPFSERKYYKLVPHTETSNEKIKETY